MPSLTLQDHVRLIWPHRPHRWTPSEGFVFDDGLPAPTDSELTASQQEAQALWDLERNPPAPVPSITPRQLRLYLATTGRLDQAKALINGISNPAQRQAAQIEWEYAVTVKRDHPLVLAIITGLSLTSAQADQAFRDASLL